MLPQQERRPALSLVRVSLILAFSILFVPLVWPLLTWRIFPSGDLTQFHLPMRFIYQEALQRGDTFLWSSALGSGLYLHAEGQTGMAHPFHLAIYRILPLTAAFNVEMLASYVAAALGMWLLLRRFGFVVEAAAAGALMFAFCGFNLMHLGHVNMVAVVAHAPWSLLAADMMLTGVDARTRALGFAATALTFGSQILLGFPQAVWLNALLLAWFVLFRAAASRSRARILSLAAALVAGAMVGAVQFLPTLDLVRSSLRAETTMAFRLSFSMHPLNLLQLVSPYLLSKRMYAPAPDEHFMHEFAVYAGAISTMSLCWVAIRWKDLSRRRETVALLSLAALGLVLALGRYGGVYILLAHLPGLSELRGSTRHMILLHLAFAGLVAVTIEDLLERGRAPLDWPRLWPLLPPAILSVLLAAGAALSPRVAWLQAHGILVGPMAALLTGTALIVATALLFGCAGRGFRFAVPLLLVLAAFDLAWWGTRYVYEQPPVPIAGVKPIRGLPPDAQPNDLVRPTALRNDMNLYAMAHLRSSTVYLGLTPSTVLNPYLLIAKRVAGVRWDWTETGWRAVKDTMPRVRLVSEWRVSTDVPADVERIDISRVALLDEPPGDVSGAPGTAWMVAERPGALAVDTNAPAAQLLVLTERFDRGWRIDVDSVSAARPLRVYGDYMGCVVPAGRHRVTFRFAPASARYGLWMTIAGLAATLVGAVLVARSGSSG